MSRSTRQHAVMPRLMTHFDLAVYLRRSEGWLRENLNRLRDEGLPDPDYLFDRNGLFDRHAVDTWLDARSRLAGASGPAGLPAPDARLIEKHLLKRVEDADI